MQLNLGCELHKFEGFVNIDIWEEVKPDILCDVKELPFENESIDFIYAGHLLEHLHYDKVLDYLKEWQRVLKESGRLVIVVPDFKILAQRYVSGEYILDHLLAPIYGQWYFSDNEFQRHHYIYDYSRLVETVKKIKWKKVERLNLEDFPEEIKPFVGKHQGISPVDWQMGVILTK